MDKKVIIWLDTFPIIHRGHYKFINYLNDKIFNKYDIDKCIIMISDEKGDVLKYQEKEALFNKIIPNFEKFYILNVDNLKIFKIIKALNLRGIFPVLIFTTPINKQMVESNIDGLKSKVLSYDFGQNTKKIEDAIINNMYQVYCDYMPEQLWSEFQNLKEIYTMNKLHENKRKIINK